MKKLALLLILTSCYQNQDEDNRKGSLTLNYEPQEINFKTSGFYLLDNKWFVFHYSTPTNYYKISHKGNSLIVEKHNKVDKSYVLQFTDTAEIVSFTRMQNTITVAAENKRGTKISLEEIRRFK